jgi:nitroreductase
MELLEAIRTTRAMRRLDPDRTVSDADLWSIVEAASKAATGSNAQPVRWIVVTDAGKRQQLGEIYRRCWAPVRDYYQARSDDASPDPGLQRVLRSADHLGDHMGDAPAIVIPASRSGDPASVFPGVQNLMLAARSLGLGTTLTTVHRGAEAEVRVVLGIPEDATTWAMIPVGYPLGKWGEAVRRPVEEITYWDGWKQARERTPAAD